jgi:anti-sigma B factor antagonist
LIDKVVRADSRRLGAVMTLSIETQISGDVFILHCNGRIVYGDECAVLRERVVSILTGSPKIVVNLAGVDHIDSEGVGMLVGLLVSARNRTGDLKLASPRQRVTDLLRRTSLETIFRVYANKDEAVAAFRKQVA